MIDPAGEDFALSMWLVGPPRRIGQWRRRARSAMHSVVESYVNTHPSVQPDELIKLVDAAYPFGERAMHPYKAWLQERKELIAVLRPEVLELPTADDFAAVEVAADLYESTEDAEATKKLLDDQAPRRLNRACPACGAKPKRPCREAKVDMNAAQKAIDYGYSIVGPEAEMVDRVVPHLSRVQP